jgi:hypothetical protein
VKRAAKPQSRQKREIDGEREGLFLGTISSLGLFAAWRLSFSERSVS